MKQQKLQMEKMKQMMENQMNNLQRTGRSDLSGDCFQIQSILILFGVNQSVIENILENFKKMNINDSALKNMDCGDDKLWKKLIPNTKEIDMDEIRRRFVAWIRYDIKKLHIHSVAEEEQKEQNNVSDDEVVTLNVSGTKYSMLKSTLLRTESSFFKRMLNENDSGNVIRDKDGNYFINRRGILFDGVLRYLQTNELCFNAKQNDYELNDLLDELKYFDIQLPAQYDNQNDARWMPDAFRFEYCCMYNQLRQFYASQFRILPKLECNAIVRKLGADLPKKCQDIESFFKIKDNLKKLGYELKDTTVFRGQPSEWTWTYVEFYQRVKWKLK